MRGKSTIPGREFQDWWSQMEWSQHMPFSMDALDFGVEGVPALGREVLTPPV